MSLPLSPRGSLLAPSSTAQAPNPTEDRSPG